MSEVTCLYPCILYISAELADADSERVVFLGATTASFTAADACDDTSVQDTTQNTKLLVKDGKYIHLSLHMMSH